MCRRGYRSRIYISRGLGKAPLGRRLWRYVQARLCQRMCVRGGVSEEMEEEGGKEGGKDGRKEWLPL